MTVRCKHGTEVYKFRCPECADEERGRNMTADKLTPDMATPQGTVAPRHAPNCKHAYMNDGFDCPFCLRDRLAASEKENALLKGAMAADDERLRNAEKRIYPDVTWGCDAAEHMADLVIGLRSELTASETRVKELERENEWRGLLVKMTVDDDYMLDSYSANNLTYGQSWGVFARTGDYDEGWPWSDVPIVTWPKADNETIPARPSDDVVAKIKEAVR